MPQNRLENYLDNATAHLSEAERQESRAELETHLREGIDLRRAQGLSETDAETDALRQFGSARNINVGLVGVSARSFLRQNANAATLFWQVVLGVTVIALAINAHTTSGMVGITSAPFVFATLPFFSAGFLVGRGPHRRPFAQLALVVVSLFLAMNVLRVIAIGSWAWVRVPTDPIGYVLIGINWVSEYVVAIPGVLLGFVAQKKKVKANRAGIGNRVAVV